jgi:hypothetical protein
VTIWLLILTLAVVLKYGPALLTCGVSRGTFAAVSMIAKDWCTWEYHRAS